jgi:hypothetical protein
MSLVFPYLLIIVDLRCDDDRFVRTYVHLIDFWPACKYIRASPPTEIAET